MGWIKVLDNLNITEGDIPTLSASKISSGTFSTSRIPTLPQSKISDLEQALNSKLSFNSFNSKYFQEEAGKIVPKGIYDPCLATNERSGCSIGDAIDRIEYLIENVETDTVFPDFLKAGYIIYSIAIYNDSKDAITIDVADAIISGPFVSWNKILRQKTISGGACELYFFHEGDFDHAPFNQDVPMGLSVTSPEWRDSIRIVVTALKIF